MNMGFCMPPPCRVCIIEDSARTFPESSNDLDLPVKDRKYTDSQYFKLIVVFLTFLIISVSVAGIRGDIRRLTHGYDDNGNICGYQNEPIRGVNDSGLDFTNKKYLEIHKIGSGSVEKNCVQICKYGYESSIIPQCRSNPWESEEESLMSTFKAICLDITLCWKEITVLCFLSICLSGLVLTLLRMFPLIVIWIVLIFVCIASVALTICSWIIFGMKKQSLDSYDDIDQEWKRGEMIAWLFIALFITIFTVFFFVMIISLRHKMKLVAALFEEGGKCIASMPTLLLQPVLTHLSVAVLSCFLVVGMACLQTSGRPEIDENGKVTFPINIFFQIMRWCLLFEYLWISQFLLGCQNMVIAAVAARWYFTRIKTNLVNPVWKSCLMVLKYHLGSIAFGSLLLTLIKAVRAICRMFQKSSDSNNRGMSILCSIVQCLFACIESFLKFLNKNAYVMIVLYSEPFCASARRALDCISSNAARVAVVEGVGSFILLVIELVVALEVTFIGVALFRTNESLYSIWIPVTIVFIFSYLCCHCFISVYDMTIDALLLCFCVDCQLNDGINRPYYMGRNFMIFLQDRQGSSTEMTQQNNTPDT